MKKIITLLAVSFLLYSCNSSVSKNDEKTSAEEENIVANYKNIEVDIEGMTCEIGCAKLIESKLSKVEGITFSKVNFEKKKGQFTFDSNKLSEKDIAKKINDIAGGDLYKVTHSELIEELTFTRDSIPSSVQ